MDSGVILGYSPFSSSDIVNDPTLHRVIHRYINLCKKKIIGFGSYMAELHSTATQSLPLIHAHILIIVNFELMRMSACIDAKIKHTYLHIKGALKISKDSIG